MGCEYLVIGGGLVGLATALKLQVRRPGARVILLEKEAEVGRHQSTHNSGVLHCGLYYQPGSLKARLAVTGIREMIAFCREHDVPHEICGKVVIATNATEETRLDELMRRGVANGLEGLRRLDRAALRRIEPHAAGNAAVHVPQEGIVDYRAVCAAMASLMTARGGQIITEARVTALHHIGQDWHAVTSAAGEFTGRFLINCAGLHCDRISALAGEKRETRIVPFRGEYFELKPARRDLVRHLIYPVPDPAFPFLGVHFTRLIQGGVECGPNAVLAFAREGYSWSKINPRDLADALSYGGLWCFLRRYPAMTITELGQSLSRARFCRALQKLVPDVTPDDLAPGGSGVRAQAMSPDGRLVQDFHLIERPHALHVLNAPSPAATASLAIGAYIAKRVVG